MSTEMKSKLGEGVCRYTRIRQRESPSGDSGASSLPSASSSSEREQEVAGILARIAAIERCGNRKVAPCPSCDGQLRLIKQDVEALASSGIAVPAAPTVIAVDPADYHAERERLAVPAAPKE